MRVPIRKAGQYAQIKPDHYMTEEAIQKLKDDVVRLQKKLPKLLEEMQEAAANGDFSENAAYQIAKGRVRGTNDKILSLQQQIHKAIPIQVGSADGIVRIGATVTIESNGAQKTYQILGAQETNPTAGKISHLSPLGSILLNHKAGDVVVFANGNKKTEYKIINVE